VSRASELIRRYNVRVRSDGCWIWTRSKFGNGYGSCGVAVRVGGRFRSWRAHRYFYSELVGDIPDGLCVLHRCDVRSCVNPEHLFVGTQAENMRDMVRKGRQARGDEHGKKMRGGLSGVAKLSECDVLDIRRLCSGGVSRRELGDMYGVNVSQISRIVTRKRWEHV
jgi:hypothetical protein